MAVKIRWQIFRVRSAGSWGFLYLKIFILLAAVVIAAWKTMYMYVICAVPFLVMERGKTVYAMRAFIKGHEKINLGAGHKFVE